MTPPKAYDPLQGYKYQILCKYLDHPNREWEHCDYAKDLKEKNYILEEYKLAYRGLFEFKVITLPKKYWPKED